MGEAIPRRRPIQERGGAALFAGSVPFHSVFLADGGSVLVALAADHRRGGATVSSWDAVTGAQTAEHRLSFTEQRTLCGAVWVTARRELVGVVGRPLPGMDDPPFRSHLVT